jgi:NAD-dependent dihydropyrimidine dehydrogenase PreA subunit
MKRNIIRIDEEKCTGCGLCIINCAEGSLEIRDGKAVLVKEALCDGLGACLGHCPEDALHIEVRDAEAFDEELVEQRLEEIGRPPLQAGHVAQAPEAASGCPGSRVVQLGPKKATAPADVGAAAPSALGHWPVQLTLVPPTAPFFKGAELLLTADCVPFAMADFHSRFLKGRAVAVACPKLDNAGAHFQKLVQVFREGGLASATLVRMEVPCCGGLTNLAADALKESGANLTLREVVVGRDGSVISERALAA